MPLGHTARQSSVPVTLPSQAPASRLRLLVRIDSPAATTTALRLTDLVETVRTIWRAYAEIDFDPIDAAASHDDELRLLITDRPQPAGSALGVVLGWIQFLNGRPGNTVTVSIQAARSLMNQGTWLGRPIDTQPAAFQQRFVTRALSRSAAHEIGHYLLRSSAHAVRGLMRGRMTIEEIMDDSPALNSLLPVEIAALEQRRAGALARTPTPAAPDPADASLAIRHQ